MTFTALEVGTALARVDLTDSTSFTEAVNVVKRYVRNKMQKYKSVSPALPGGKLEALERKYAPLGYQDVFYIARLELLLPASSVPLPRPSDAVRQRLEDAGFPLPDVFADASGPSSPVTTRAVSIRPAHSIAPAWITEEDFMAGMPLTRETFGLAAKSAKKAQKEAEILAAAALAGQVGIAPVPPVPQLPPVPPPPRRAPSNPIPIPALGADFKAPCGCLDHPQSRDHHHHSGSIEPDYKISAEAARGDSPTLPLSPRHVTMPLNDSSSAASFSNMTPSSPSLNPNRRHTADIRALFEALPPEAQALAVQRLDEAKLKQVERKRAEAAAERRAVANRTEEEQRERDRQQSWERAKARERDIRSHKNATAQLRRESTRLELEKQRLQLIATQQLSSSSESDVGSMAAATADSSTLHGLVEALPAPPPRVDEDARRMIEARIATLQSALAAMGIDPGSPSLPATPSRSPVHSPVPGASPSRTFRQSSTSQFSHASLPSPIITTPRSPFMSQPLPQPQGRRYSNTGGGHSPSTPQPHPFTQTHSPTSTSPTAAMRCFPNHQNQNQPAAFDLDEHIGALCRPESCDSSHTSQSGGTTHSHSRSRSRAVVPLTPGAIVNATGPPRKETRRSPPPTYSLVDRRM